MSPECSAFPAAGEGITWKLQKERGGPLQPPLAGWLRS
jgi:hypothetical protein